MYSREYIDFGVGIYIPTEAQRTSVNSTEPTHVGPEVRSSIGVGPTVDLTPGCICIYLHILLYTILDRSRTPELRTGTYRSSSFTCVFINYKFFYICDTSIIPSRINDDQDMINAYAEKYAFLLSDILDKNNFFYISLELYTGHTTK